MISYSNTVNTHGTLGNPLLYIVIWGKIDAVTKPFYYYFSRDSETIRTLATSSNGIMTVHVIVFVNLSFIFILWQ